MSEKTGQFRSAAFGGYHRQDVLDYIESMTKEKRDLETRCREAEEGRAEAERRLADGERELEVLREKVRSLEEETERLQAGLETAGAELEESRAEAASLREEVEDLKPGAESWRYIRERAGDIEISAHERAQMTIRDARSQSDMIREESARWMEELQACCERVQRDLQSSLRAAEAELDGARDSFTRAETEMGGVRQALESLRDKLEASAAAPEETPD